MAELDLTQKLTVKQSAFCEEYLIDLNATQAAIRVGYKINRATPKKGYYTYALICSVKGDVFYIGKGKGARVHNHVKNRNKESGNERKNKRINDCLKSGGEVFHLILSTHNDEQEAYSNEFSLITRIGIENLTNISKSEMKARLRAESDLPSIYDFPIVSEWANECLKIINEKGGKLYFLGAHSESVQSNLMAIFERASKDNSEVVK